MRPLSERFAETYLLKDVSMEHLERLARIAVVKDFPAGETLLRQFAHGYDLLILLEGDARINSYSGERLAECGPGAVLGEIALVDNQPRSATVVAKGPVKAAVIPSSDLQELLDLYPDLAASLYHSVGRILSARLRAANAQLDLLQRGQSD